MVPMTSAGSRSGVNWIRENAMRRHSATVRTARVLASPGTPSSSTCPPVSKPMSRRSTINSCATTRFATSCAIVLLSTASPVFSKTIAHEVAKRVVAQELMVERLLIGLLTGGHVLLEGVPGLAKTLAVRTVAESLRISFSRIQFTPDLLPADVIGTMVFDQRSQEFYAK